MPQRNNPDEPDVQAADLQALARDWITLWQSELAAAAVDQEAQEQWQTLMSLWAGAAAAMLHAMPRAAADATRPGTAVAPRPPPAAAAPDPRDAEIERLGRRIAELERRLAELERGLLAAQAQAIAAGLAGQDAEFRGAVLAEALRQDRELIAGIAAYRRHPWRREMPEVPVLWSEGGSRLLDFGGTGPTVLVVPSLVNRATVLDLAPGRSMLRFLAGAGLRVLLLDWGWPGETERQFTLTDYVAGRLERALLGAGEKVVLAGYCMGGLLTVAAAQRRPDRVAALVLLATPWDFHGDEPERAASLARLLPLFEPAMAFGNTLPVDALQTLFALLDPFGIAAKYRGFAALDPDSERARLFVALEDWLNDGVPLAAPVARECLAGWYGANTPAAGQWRIAGLPVDPTTLDLPSFVAVPARDRIVPPESARPLAGLIRGAVLHEPRAGHIGMAAGSSAEAALWQPLLGWIRSLG